MILRIILLNLAILITVFPIICEFKVIIYLRLNNYRNPNDIKHDGWKCESFHWLNDHCDPMFDVCVTSNYRCDILDHFISHWKNQKSVYSVLSRTMRLDNIKRSLSVDVKVTDHDRYDAHDHIAQFTAHFYMAELNNYYGKQMTVSPRGLNVHLYASVMMECEKDYYGYNCDKYCKPRQFNYDCVKSSGRSCLLDCGRFGSCMWNSFMDKFTCVCREGWTGTTCKTKHYNICSQIGCSGSLFFKPRCYSSGGYLECSCKVGPYFKSCKERITTTTRSSTTSTTTTTTLPTMTITSTTKTTTERRTTTERMLATDPSTSVKPTTAVLFMTKGTPLMTPKYEFTTTEVIKRSNLKKGNGSHGRTSSSLKILNVSQSLNAVAISTSMDRGTKNKKEESDIIGPSNSFNHVANNGRTSENENNENIKQRQENTNKLKGETANQQVSTQQSSAYSPTTIIIIALLILLCICVIMLTIVIRGWKRKAIISNNGYFLSPHANRPLPSVVYKTDPYTNKVKSSVLMNPDLPSLPQFEYDQCTIQIGSLDEKKPLHLDSMKYFKDMDPYEEPMINNHDSMTCQTEIAESYEDLNNAYYEEPRKIK